MSDESASARRPFIGLRPFDYLDREYFFGRFDEIKAVESLMRKSRFVAIVGSSGTGKSSLVRAGLLPMLESSEGGWRCQTLTPGEAPIRRLARAISEFRSNSYELRDAWNDRIELKLRSSRYGICEAISMFPPSDRKGNFLLIIDQFEELFRFADLRGNGEIKAVGSINRDEATAFVRLILDANGLPAVPIHFVITMRSDFIGDCARFHDLPESVSRHQFLVPGLKRDKREEAITQPIEKSGSSIEPELVQRLLNDTNDDPDPLPIVQHAMMRCWQYAIARKQDGDALRITVEDYLAIGEAALAISLHADEILQALSCADTNTNKNASSLLIAKRVFQTLTEVDRNGRITRRPMKYGELRQCVTSSDWNETEARTALRIVVDRFAAPDCSFLRIASSGAHEDDSIVDIGHEALIRRWDKLKGEGDTDWIREEQDAVDRYHFLLTVARSKGIISGSELDGYDQWWRERKPTSAWAKRYSKDNKNYIPSISQLFESSRKAKCEVEETRRRAARTLQAQLEANAARAQAEAAMAKSEAEAARATIAEEKANAANAQAAVNAARAAAAEQQARLESKAAMAQANLRHQQVRANRILTALVVVSLLSAGVAFFLFQDSVESRNRQQTLVVNASKGILATPLIAGAADALDLLLAIPNPSLDRSYLNAIYESLEMLREIRRIPLESASRSATDAQTAKRSPESPDARTNSRPVFSVSINPKRNLVVAVSERKLHFIQYENGGTKIVNHLETDLPVEGTGWTTVRWSPDGQELYVVAFGTAAVIWRPCFEPKLRSLFVHCNANSGTEITPLEGDASLAGVGTWSSDGKYILSSNFFGSPHVWDADSGVLDKNFGQQFSAQKDAKEAITTLAISSSGKFLAEGFSGGKTIVKNVSNWQIQSIPIQGPISLAQLLFNPTNDNQLLAISQTQPVLLNIGQTETNEQRLGTRSAMVLQAAFDPNGKFVITASNDGVLRLFDITSINKDLKGIELRGHTRPVFAVDVAQDGTIVSGSADGTVRFWSRDAARSLTSDPSYDSLTASAIRKIISDKLPFFLYGEDKIELPESIRCSLTDACNGSSPGSSAEVLAQIARALFQR